MTKKSISLTLNPYTIVRLDELRRELGCQSMSKVVDILTCSRTCKEKMLQYLTQQANSQFQFYLGCLRAVQHQTTLKEAPPAPPEEKMMMGAGQ